MRIRFCGVRGSTAAPGAQFVRVGGHTSCVAVTADGEAVPRLLLDAGTGIRTVTGLLDGAPFEGTILLSHLHWDHVQGLPFFAVGDRPDAVVSLRLPDDGEPADRTLARAMSPPHFPIGPEGLAGTWSFETIDEGVHRIEGFEVAVREIPHKGGRTLGYRITDAFGSLTYLPDHRPAPGGQGHDAALELARGADVLVHDAQFLADEAALAAAYGHARVDQALALATEAGVGRLVLFHHVPARTDDALDDLVASLSHGDRAPVLAREGLELDLTAARSGASRQGCALGVVVSFRATPSAVTLPEEASRPGAPESPPAAGRT